MKTLTSAQGRTSCLCLTVVLSSTSHFQTCNKLYCTQSFCRFRREITKLRLHHHYQQRDLSYYRFDLFHMGVGFSIFSLVDLGFLCHLESVYTLTWENVYRSFVPNVALRLCSTIISFTFCPTVNTNMGTSVPPLSPIFSALFH